MAIGKVVKEVVKKVVKGAAKATVSTPLNKVVDSANTKQLRQATDELFFEFNAATRQGLDESLRTTPLPFQAEAELAEAGLGPKTIFEMETAAQFVVRTDPIRLKQARDANLFEADAELNYSFQTSNPEEFSKRLANQLEDPEFAAKTLFPGGPDLDELFEIRARADSGTLASTEGAYLQEIDEIGGRLRVERAFQEESKQRLFKTQGYQKKLEGLIKDLPYGDRIFVHIARQTDPTRANRTLIGFEDALEMGIHSGTNKAAILETIRSPDQAKLAFEGIDTDIIDIAIATGMTEKQASKMLFSALEQFFEIQFTTGRGRAVEFMGQDFAPVLEAAFEANGFPSEAVKSILARAKQLPKASSTPHFFLGKNGLLLSDLQGNFRPDEVARQLQEIFTDPGDFEIIAASLGKSRKESTIALQEFIELRGFDHIVYHNNVGDRGLLSIINWNEDLMLSMLDPRLVGEGTMKASQVATSFLLGSFGVGVGSAELRN